MGRPKVVTIDDSQPETEIKNQKSKIKNTNQKSKVEETVENNVILSESAPPQSGKYPWGEGSATNLEDSSLRQAQGKLPQNDKQEKAAETKKAAKKSVSKKYRSSKYLEKRESLDKTKTYSLNEALEMVKNGSYSKFVGTLEAHINTPNTGIRGLVSLPHAAGKKIRILAFGTGAEESGADIVGTEEVIEEINKGKINFDLVVTTPQWMPKLAKVARILGPRGIMPNPKNGTITDDIKKAVEGFQAGKTEYKTEGKAPIIHIALGKLDQPAEELAANVKALVITLGKSRIKKLTIAPTIGPSVKVSLNSI